MIEISVKPEESGRSKLCEALGVELDQEFYFRGEAYRVRPYGIERNLCVVSSDVNLLTSAYTVCDMVEHPEMIRRYLTEKEKAIMRMLGARYAARDEIESGSGVDAVGLWSEMPELDGGVWEGEGYSRDVCGDVWIADVSARLFPSVDRGACVRLDGE